MTAAFTLTRNAPLRGLNTLRVAATSRWLGRLHHPDAIPALLDLPDLRGLPVLVLGEGSNVLFAGDFPGLVLHPALRGMED